MNGFHRRVTVVVVDAYELRRFALGRAFAGQGGFETVGESAHLKEAAQLVRSLSPQVAVIGLELLEESSEATIRDLRREGIETPVVIVALDPDRDLVLRLLIAGADGFVDGRASIEELLEVIAAAARHETRLPSDLQRRLVSGIESESQRPLSVTKRELQVLRLLAEGFPGPEIARALHVSTSTVHTHLHHLYGKLEVPNAAAAVAEGGRRGLLHLATSAQETVRENLERCTSTRGARLHAQLASTQRPRRRPTWRGLPRRDDRLVQLCDSPRRDPHVVALLHSGPAPRTLGVRGRRLAKPLQQRVA